MNRSSARKRIAILLKIGLAAILLAVTAPGQQYAISTFAGGGPLPSPLATPVLDNFIGEAGIGDVGCVAVDTAGTMYFTGAYYSSVFQLDSSGTLTRVAGTGVKGYSGDGGPAINAQLADPGSVAVDSSGNLYIADGPRIRKVSAGGIISTVVVTGDSKSGVAVDSSGSLYIAGAYRIRKVSPAGIISTVAGNGSPLVSCAGGPAPCASEPPPGDGGPAISAPLDFITGLAVDGSGNLYIGGFNRIRKVSPAGIISTVAGNGYGGFSGDGGPSISAQLARINGLAVDGSGNLYIAANLRIRKISTDSIITTVEGTGIDGYSDGGFDIRSPYVPHGVAVDNSGNLYVGYGKGIRRMSANGIINTVIAGGGVGDGGPASTAQLYMPRTATVDSSGNVYIADSGNNRIRKVSPGGIISTVAGNGYGGFSGWGDGGPAISAGLPNPLDIAVDSSGTLFILEDFGGSIGYGLNRIRRVSPDGTIGTLAPIGIFCGDRPYEFDDPLLISVDNSGNLYVVLDGWEWPEFSVCKVSSGGTITWIASSFDPGGLGGPAISAPLDFITGLAVDDSGNLYIGGFNRIRKVTPAGIISTVATGYSGDGGPATSAQLDWSGRVGMAVDNAGNIYIADYGNNRIRKISVDGVITTIAGTGVRGHSGDGGPAISAQLYGPWHIAVDSTGQNIYVTEPENHTVRLIQAVR